MIEEPRCWSRRCKHFVGIKQDAGDELSERCVCKAFPDGIPEGIAYGDNLHTKPYPGDGGVQFEAKSKSD